MPDYRFRCPESRITSLESLDTREKTSVLRLAVWKYITIQINKLYTQRKTVKTLQNPLFIRFNYWQPTYPGMKRFASRTF